MTTRQTKPRENGTGIEVVWSPYPGDWYYGPMTPAHDRGRKIAMQDLIDTVIVPALLDRWVKETQERSALQRSLIAVLRRHLYIRQLKHAIAREVIQGQGREAARRWLDSE